MEFNRRKVSAHRKTEISRKKRERCAKTCATPKGTIAIKMAIVSRNTVKALLTFHPRFDQSIDVAELASVPFSYSDINHGIKIHHKGKGE